MVVVFEDGFVEPSAAVVVVVVDAVDSEADVATAAGASTATAILRNGRTWRERSCRNGHLTRTGRPRH